MMILYHAVSRKVHFCLLNLVIIQLKNVDNLSDSDFEENVLHRDILFNLLIPGSVIALYSPANARQLLILWSYSRVMLILVLLIITTICDVSRDLLPFVQLKKR